MRRTIGVVAAMLLAGPAVAQTGKKAAKPAEPPPAADTTQASAPPPAPAPTPAPSTGKVSIAPPEEAGWTVVELPGGYYRYRTDDAEPGEGGGVTVQPPEPAHGALAPRQPMAAAPREAPPPPAMTAGYEAAPSAPPCEQERGVLNQRLYELRGLNVDPASANALADSEKPLQPAAWANVPGYGPGLGSFLVTAAQSDTPTRERLAEYARCVERSQGR